MSANSTTTLGGLGSSRQLGRFELERLVGRSSRTMVWEAHDSRSGAQVLLTMPRQIPLDTVALEAWWRGAHRAARLEHPALVPVREIGIEQHWPFIACDRESGRTLDEHLAAHAPPAPLQSAHWLCEALQGLAYAHEAGLAHADIGGGALVLDTQGRMRLMALGAAGGLPGASNSRDAARTMDSAALQSQRDACERDLVGCGLVLHRLLAGVNALDEPDIPTAIERLPREIARLGWSTPHPVPDALRAISNRATERDARRRYVSARSLERALQGWIEAQASDSVGPLALLLDRMQRVGALPAQPGLPHRLARIASMERQRVTELVEVIVEDPALMFELLRVVNAARFGAAQVSGNAVGEGPISTVRRAVQLVGMQGVRDTASGLRHWPGPLAAPADQPLARAMRDTRMAGQLARLLCPADMDSEAALVVAYLQQLGSMLLNYHFPEEAQQIERLMHPGAEPDAPRPMDATAAAHAVLGVDAESLGMAVARHWRLDEALLQAMRRLPLDTPVRNPDDRADRLRVIASAACEAVTATREAAPAAALQRVVQRYARSLGLSTAELNDALVAARRSLAGAPGRVGA